jgi:hypothetical protein
MVEMVTTRSRPKAWTWSYSKLKNLESCPKRHYHVDIARDVKEDESEALSYGNAVHKALAARISAGKPLPKPFAHFEPWAEKVLTGAGNILVEQKLAITEEFAACGYFDNGVWFRSVGDVIKLNGPVALAIDWKTGKILEDAPQLALMAACIFAAYPDVQKIRTEFVWLKEDATSRMNFDRNDMPTVWSNLWPRITALKTAHDEQNYPPKPGFLCKRWCPVSKCPHHGE